MELTYATIPIPEPVEGCFGFHELKFLRRFDGLNERFNFNYSLMRCLTFISASSRFSSFLLSLHYSLSKNSIKINWR